MTRRLSLLVALLLLPTLVYAAEKKDDKKKKDEKKADGQAVALVAPPWVLGGQPVRLSLRFSGPVHAEQTFDLSSSDPSALRVPATVSLSAPDGEVAFTVQTAESTTEKTVTISLRGSGRELTTRVIVRPTPLTADRPTGQLAPGSQRPPSQPPR
jgi:hypothetical protein